MLYQHKKAYSGTKPTLEDVNLLLLLLFFKASLKQEIRH